jgi:molybdate transport system substrate-binding protein
MRPSARAATLGLAVVLAGPVLSTVLASAAGAAEITILLNQSTASGVRELARGFAQASGHRVNVSLQRTDVLKEKLQAGAPADLVSLFYGEFDPLVASATVVPGSVAEYGRVFNGVAVRAGAHRPDISTPAAFTQAMLEAHSIGHTLIGTGPFNTRLFHRLGIYDAIRDRITIVPPGTLVAEAVARGDVEIGIQQANVIQPFPGTDYLGPLPADLIEYGRAGVGLLAVSREPQAAKAFITFMTDRANAELLRKGSMETPGP